MTLTKMLIINTSCSVMSVSHPTDAVPSLKAPIAEKLSKQMGSWLSHVLLKTLTHLFRPFPRNSLSLSLSQKKTKKKSQNPKNSLESRSHLVFVRFLEVEVANMLRKLKKSLSIRLSFLHSMDSSSNPSINRESDATLTDLMPSTPSSSLSGFRLSRSFSSSSRCSKVRVSLILFLLVLTRSDFKCSS